MCYWTSLTVICQDSISFPGTYSTGKATFCQTCPAGQACPNNDEAPSVTCNGMGEYSFAGQDSCTNCLAGQACPNPDGTGIVYCQPVSRCWPNLQLVRRRCIILIVYSIRDFAWFQNVYLFISA